MDAYALVEQVRHDIGEREEAHWSNRGILRKLNLEQKRLWMQLALQAGDWLVTSASVTVTDSSILLPSRCAKPIYLENEDGYPIEIEGTVRERKLNEFVNVNFDNGLYSAYLQGNYIKLTRTGISGTWTLWYIERYRDMAYGEAGPNSAASALHFDPDMWPSPEDDYYNDLAVNTYTVAGVPKLATTITDYVGTTRIATITGTPAHGDRYGTVCSIPEEGHGVLLARTVLSCLAKPSSAIDPKYFEYHAALLRSVERDWAQWIDTRIPGARAVRITRREHG